MEDKNYNTEVDFILQSHNADVAGKHYDLRIQYPFKSKNHLMASWALPKHIIPTGSTKVLAARTPDHNHSVWMNFHGEIKSGYGKGTVTIIQKGRAFINLFTDSHITFTIKGKTHNDPLNGKYSLIKFGKVVNKSQEAWILIKHSDK